MVKCSPHSTKWMVGVKSLQRLQDKRLNLAMLVAQMPSPGFEDFNNWWALASRKFSNVRNVIPGDSEWIWDDQFEWHFLLPTSSKLKQKKSLATCYYWSLLLYCRHLCLPLLLLLLLFVAIIHTLKYTLYLLYWKNKNKQNPLNTRLRCKCRNFCYL